MAVDQDIFNKLTFLCFPVFVEQDVIDFSKPLERVWFQRSGLDPQLFNDGTAALTTETYDIETMSTSISQAQALANTIRTLNGFKGMLGMTPVCALFVHDQSDNYIPKNQFASDFGFHICSVKIELLY